MCGGLWWFSAFLQNFSPEQIFFFSSRDFFIFCKIHHNPPQKGGKATR
nr:MAG TPA: glycoprotein [Caudoviricetes sp.]